MHVDFSLLLLLLFAQTELEQTADWLEGKAIRDEHDTLTPY